MVILGMVYYCFNHSMCLLLSYFMLLLHSASRQILTLPVFVGLASRHLGVVLDLYGRRFRQKYYILNQYLNI